jgi:Cu-processing system permease protein
VSENRFMMQAQASVRRISAIALNTYREAVRARLLLGIFAVGMATCLYSAVVAAQSLHNELRVVANVGAASLSFYAVLTAIVLGSTSLYRELELKTVFPILSRPLRRWEYLLGKYLGTVLTVAVFVALEAGTVLGLLALQAGQQTTAVLGAGGATLALGGLVFWRARSARVFVLIPWSLVFVVAAWVLAAPAFGDRQYVTASSVLSVFEIGIVAAIATLFSSFSSPFLTAGFTAMLFMIGRSADTLERVPEKVFGRGIATTLRSLAHVVPNLQTYVPPRPLLLGDTAMSVWRYVAMAGAQAVAYSLVLMVVASLAFSRRDFS